MGIAFAGTNHGLEWTGFSTVINVKKHSFYNETAISYEVTRLLQMNMNILYRSKS
jgi:hypothetical protein